MAFLGLSIPAAIVNSGLRCVAVLPIRLHAHKRPSFAALPACNSVVAVLDVSAALALCRFFQKQIQLAFMMRLTRHLHRLYCSNRSYYAASVLGGGHPSNALPYCLVSSTSHLGRLATVFGSMVSICAVFTITRNLASLAVHPHQ